MSKFKSTKPISAVIKSDKRNNFFSYWTSATTTKRNLGLEISKKSFNCKIVYKERYRERQGDEETKTPKPTSTVHRHGEKPPDCSSLRRSLKLLLLSLFAFWECLKLEINCFCHVNKEGCCTVHRFLWRRVPGESPHVPPPPFTIKGLVCTAILQKILSLLLMQLLDSGRSVQAFVSVCLKKAMKVVLLPPNILILLLPISIHKSFLTQFLVDSKDHRLQTGNTQLWGKKQSQKHSGSSSSKKKPTWKKKKKKKQTCRSFFNSNGILY